jgi:hypothetical protein
MTTLLTLLAVAILLWFVWRFIKALWAPQEAAKPVDPNSLVPAPRRRGPKERGGAVALEEPDEEELQSFPPRYQ